MNESNNKEISEDELLNKLTRKELIKAIKDSYLEIENFKHVKKELSRWRAGEYYLQNNYSKQSYNRADEKTLLDEFAMAVLTGLCANNGYIGQTYESAAEETYRQAEAMLAERNKLTLK